MANAPNWPMLTTTCPRCGFERVTLDLRAEKLVAPDTFETFCICRKCSETSIIKLYNERGSSGPSSYMGTFVDSIFRIENVVVTIPNTTKCPDYTPVEIASIFTEASRCMAIGCHDAAGTMFRKVLDSATRGLLPAQPDPEDKAHADYIPWKVRKDLALRLEFLFDSKVIPEGMRELASCVREDGNDAAHDIVGISHAEAQDLEDFTLVLLETVYTLPGQIEANKARRTARRSGLKASE